MRTWVAGLGCVVLAGVPAVYLLAHRRADDRVAVNVSDGAGEEAPARASSRAASTPAWMHPSPSVAAPGAASGTPPSAGPDGRATAIAPAQEDAPGPVVERDRQIEALRLSGPDSEGLLAATGAAREAWKAFTTGGGVKTEATPWECHRAGCFSTAVHTTMESVEEATSHILSAAEIASWRGRKSRSAPIVRPDGKVEVTWILGAPRDEGTATP
jgi:hypothetical protein